MTYIKFRLPQTLTSVLAASFMTFAIPAAYAASYIDTSKPIALEDFSVLQSSGNIFLVKNKDGREVVLGKSGTTYYLLGYISKFRTGTQVYHWGNANAKQALAWDKEGRIPPDLLKKLKADKNQGMMGGGFYVSLDRSDSSSYGNVQVTVEMTRDFKVLTKTNGGNWQAAIPHLEKLGISAIQHPSQSTWFNIIDAEALTKEHVTKSADWAKKWAEVRMKEDILNKYPDIYTNPVSKAQVAKYFNYLRLISSEQPDQVFAAFKYFVDNKSAAEADVAFDRLNSKYQKQAIDLLAPLSQAHATELDFDSRMTLNILKKTKVPSSLMAQLANSDKLSMRLLAAELSSDNPASDARILEGLTKDPELDVRQQAWSTIGKRNDPATFELLRKQLSSSSEEDKINALSNLKSRSEKQAVDLIKTYIGSDNSTLANLAIGALAGRQDLQSLQIIEELLHSPNPMIQRTAFSALAGRRDSASLRLILSLVQSDDYMKKFSAVNMILARNNADSLALAKQLIRQNDNSFIMPSLEKLKNTPDAEGLALAKQVFNEQGYGSKANALLVIAKNETSANALEYIREGLKDTLGPLQVAALQAATDLKDTVPFEMFEPAINRLKGINKMPLFEALQYRTDAASFEYIKSNLGSNDPTDQSLAARALQYRSEPEALQLLIKYASTSPAAVYSLKNKTTGIKEFNAEPNITPEVKFAHQFNILITEAKRPVCSRIFAN